MLGGLAILTDDQVIERPVSELKPFYGWVPNVAGRLSFSIIGETKHPAPCLKANIASADERFIVCVQNRNLLDALVGGTYFKWLTGFDARTTFVMIASTEQLGEDKIGVLKGEIYAFSRSSWQRRGNGIWARFDRLQRAINSLTWSELSPLKLGATLKHEIPSQPGPILGDPSLAERVKSLIFTARTHDPEERVSKYTHSLGEIASDLRRLSLFRSSFRLQRNGVVKLHDPVVQEGLRFTLSVTEEARPITSSNYKYFYNQCFFFIKDLAHSHRHHHRKYDTITLAKEMDPGLRWVRETQYSIHKEVLRQRRESWPKNLYNALGLMSYMQSFSAVIKALDAKDFNPPEVESAELEAVKKEVGDFSANSYNIKPTEESIKAQIEMAKWKRTQTNTVVVAIPALAIALMSIFKEERSNLFYFLRQAVLRLTEGPISGTAFVIYALVAAAFWYGRFHLRDFEFIDHNVKIFQELEDNTKGFVSLGFMLLSGALGGLCFLLTKGPISVLNIYEQMWIFLSILVALLLLVLSTFGYLTTAGVAYRNKLKPFLKSLFQGIRRHPILLGCVSLSLFLLVGV